MKLNRQYLKKRLKSFLSRRVLPAKISVIVPVYNGKDTIGECLDSLLMQTQRRIKIICVNDGSTDNTGEILTGYKKRDRRIKVITQKNGGRAAARNTGLGAVKTKYVMFCDSDDRYEKVMCENMLDAIERSNADLAVCAIKMIYEAHEEMKKSDDKYYELKFDGKKTIDDDVILNTNGSLCNKIFKMEIVDKNSITFPKGVNTAEDFYFCCAYMSTSNTIFFLHQQLYTYVRRNESIMSSNFSGKNLSLDDIYVTNELFKYYIKSGYLNEHKDLFWRQWIASFWASYRYSAKKYYPEIKRIAKKFLDANYERYKPDDKELQKWKRDIDKTLEDIKEVKNG